MVEGRGGSASEAERYARSLIETSINPLVATNPQGKITDANAATVEAIGIPRDRLIGSDFTDCFSEPEKARAVFQRVLEEGLVNDHPLVLRHVSGALTDVEYNATVYRDESGELRAVFIAGRDPAEAQQARLQVARLAVIAASSQDAAFTRDLEGTITSWNAAAEMLYGYAAEDAIGRNGAILIPPGREGETQEFIKRMLQRDRGFGFETQRLCKDGTLLDVALMLAPIRDTAGDIMELSIIAHDVSRRVRAERELRESEEKFSAAFQACPDLMDISRLGDGTLLEVNEGFTQLLGHKRGEAIGKTVSQLSIWADPADRAAFVARLEDFGRISGLETTLRRKDGALIRCLASARTIELLGEACVLSIFHDISERERAEEALRGSEAHLRTLIDTLPDLVWLKDTDGIYLSCNRRFESFFGAPERDIIGKTDYDFTDADQADSFRQHDKAAMAAAAPRANEEVLVFADDGHHEVLETIKTSVHDSDGRLIGVLGVGRDITERKQAEEALRESEGLLRGLFDNMPSGAGIYEVRGDGSRGSDYIVKDFNAAGLRIEGKTRKEVVGKSLTDLRPAIDEYGLIPALQGVWQTGEPALLPAALYSDEHYANWYENRIFRLLSGEVVAIYDDVTERKEAEGRLSESEARYRGYVDNAPYGVFVTDEQGGYVEVNRAAAEQTGYAQSDLAQMNITELLAPQSLESGQQEFQHLVLTGASSGNLVLVRKDGTSFPVRLDAVRLSATRYLGFIIDVSEQQRAAAEIEASAAQVRQALTATVAALSATTELRDPYTAGHQRRVAELAGAIAAGLGWDAARIEMVETAGLLHDVGKIIVPAEILAKPGRLSEIEMQIIRGHAAASAALIAGIEFAGPVAAIVNQHHERLDGSGYPQGLTGESMLPEARILAVADVVEAMSSHRPYRPALGMEAALAEVREHAGEKYDADVVVACARLIEEQGFQFTP